MLNKVKTMKNYKLESLDGEIGKVKELYFDDKHWTTRYLVVETGNWLTNRQVLISPYALDAVNKDKQSIYIKLTKKEIEDSPPLDSNKPVSRQYEEAYYGYYGWPVYWAGSLMWGYDSMIVRDPAKWKKSIHGKTDDPNLRSTEEVSGYYIHAKDGEIGHIEDFIVDDITWAIRYLIVNTQNWLPGKSVLISPKWIKAVSWGESKVFIDLTKDDIKQAPEFTDESLITRDYEILLHSHYKIDGYWLKKPAKKKHSKNK